MRHICLLLIIAGLFISGIATAVHAAQIRIAAAASLTEAVKAVIAEYERIHPGTQILPHFASSGALARQVTNGAPADIYISANPQWMTYLQNNKSVVPHTTMALVQNSLVFTGLATGSIKGIDDLRALERVAMCNPASSPAGRYAERALRATGLYTRLEHDKRLIFAKDVRQALLYADRGEVDGAFVYRTDALLAQHAEVLFQVDPALHPQIVYPAAMTPGGAEHPAALDFFAFLAQERAQTIFRNYGFIVPADSGS